MKLDKQKLADYNRGSVIELISKNGPINRSEIAKQLGLSIPTIMKIADDFIDEGIIRITGKAESTGGKRPLLYEIIEDAYYCIGLDIGRSKINTILTNLHGRIVNKTLINVKNLNTPEEFLKVIINQIDLILLESKIINEKIMGIGVGVPGIIDRKSGIILYSPNFHWENIDLVSPLKEKFGFKVLIENSNRTMALGEKWAEVDLAVLNDKELDLNTSMMYRNEDYIDAIKLINDKKVQLTPLITKYFDFKDYNNAYEYIESEQEKTMKVIINVQE